jgi:DNA modification methylase
MKQLKHAKTDSLTSQTGQSLRNLQVRRVPVEQVFPDPRNARTHNVAQIAAVAASILEFGWTNAILVRPTGVVIAGHARLLAARKLALTEVPVIELGGLSEPQCRALTIADNQLALNAGWDEDLLHAELAALQEQEFDLKVLGFDEKELARLVAELDTAGGLTDPDAVPAIPQAAVTASGDLWVMGDHRLLCGDALSQPAMEAVLGGGRADMVFTDPPDSAPAEGKTTRRRKTDHDSSGGKHSDFLRAACVNLIAMCEGAIYICTSSSEAPTLQQAFTESGGHWSTFVIWAQHHFTLGRSDYQRQYEPILYGWPARRGRYWGGDRNQADVWSIPRPLASRERPTIKPVELVERAVQNSSRMGSAILDPFAGSGTTLIACQRQKRKARLIEIDPQCADVICQRWRQHTGNAAVLEGDGRGFEEIASERREVSL